MDDRSLHHFDPEGHAQLHTRSHAQGRTRANEIRLCHPLSLRVRNGVLNYRRSAFLFAADFSISRRSSAACSSHENLCAVETPFAASLLRNCVPVARARIASVNSVVFSGSVSSNASNPFVSHSLTPALGLTMTGSPHAMASRTGRLKESSSDGATKMSAVA